MAILAFAVVVGNAEAIMRRLGFSLGEGPLELDLTVRTAHSQISFIVKSFFFTFIGLMLSPPWAYLALGVLFGAVLLGARIPMVWLSTRRAGFNEHQVKMITVALPRGMAAGVLATMPAYLGVSGTQNLPPLVFAAVLTSILIFAVGLPMVRRHAAAPQGAVASSMSPAGSPVPAADPRLAGLPPGAAAEVVPVPAVAPVAAALPAATDGAGLERPSVHVAGPPRP
jgi:NhaP-type Na+/H+ and K+/H+ antiporter